MKDKLANFYKGDFTYKNPKLLISETKVELSVCAGSIYKGFFTILGDKNKSVKGLLISSCPLLKLKTKEFFAVKTVINYEFDASHLEVGDTLSEHIKVISDCGEYFIDISIKIVRPFFESKMGKIMDLTRFTYLARYDLQQAASIFASDEFSSYILSKDDNYAFIRKQLLKSKSLYHALEEFLVAIHQKLAVKLSINQTKLFYDMGKDAIADRILINKESWGYVEIDISTDAPFLLIDKNKVTSEDFIGNSYFLELIVLPEKMHRGVNYGKIYVKTTYETIVIEVKAVASCNKDNKRTRLELKSHSLNLVNLYLDYRFKNISREKYLTSVNDLLAKIKLISSSMANPENLDYHDLYYIQLLVLNNEEEKGKKLLDKISHKSANWKRHNPDLYYAYLALTALYSNGKEAKKIVGAIEKFYNEQGSDNPHVFLSLLYLGSSNLENNKKVLLETSRLFAKGCRSPYIYFEALKILNENPSYLTSLNQFEIQVINFGLKYNKLSRELANQFVYLASKAKNYNKLVFQALTQVYEDLESIDVLNAICSLVIKGNKRSNVYFKWYKLGVLANLRIAELYEYFMHSLDEEVEQVLPQNLLYYFAYSNTLSVEKKSYLYAYVISHKNEIEETYKIYIRNIEKFAFEQLLAGRINKYMAIVYKEVYKTSQMFQDKRKLLWNVIFRYDLECSNPNIKGVLLVHKELEKETYIPLNKGKAQIDLYNDEAEVFLVDSQDNLYHRAIDYKIKKIIDISSSEVMKLDFREELPESIIFTAYKGLENKFYYEKYLQARLKAIKLQEISQDFRDKLLLSLVSYHYSRENFLELDKYIELLDYIPIKSKNKYKFIELLIERKFYERAFREVDRYGFYKLDKDKVYDLSTGLIKQGHDRNKTLLIMSYYCLINNKHNTYILAYLLEHYLGTCKELFNIWDAALSYTLETRELEARLLTQVLFTQCNQIDIQRVYKSFTRNGINSPLAKAFLNYQAFEYLARDNSIDQDFFKSMELLVKTEQNDCCILALLKYYANQEKMVEEEIKFAHRFLEEYIKKGIILPFFKKFKAHMVLPYNFIHKTFLHIKAQPGDKVFITYRYLDRDKPIKDEIYTKEVIDHTFAGIFVKSFLLFYGEKVEYSISVEDSDGNLNVSEEKILEPDQDMEVNDDNLYNQINYMKLALDINDEKAFIDTYNNISMTNYITSNLFKPL